MLNTFDITSVNEENYYPTIEVHFDKVNSPTIISVPSCKKSNNKLNINKLSIENSSTKSARNDYFSSLGGMGLPKSSLRF